MHILINKWKKESIDVLAGFLFPMWVSPFQLISASPLCSQKLAVLPSASLSQTHQLDVLVQVRMMSGQKDRVVEQGGRGGPVARQERNEESEREKPELKRQEEGVDGKEAPMDPGKKLNVTINQ